MSYVRACLRRGVGRAASLLVLGVQQAGARSVGARRRRHRDRGARGPGARCCASGPLAAPLGLLRDTRVTHCPTAPTLYVYASRACESQSTSIKYPLFYMSDVDATAMTRLSPRFDIAVYGNDEHAMRHRFRFLKLTHIARHGKGFSSFYRN